MKDQHYKEKLSAFAHQELTTAERQQVADHLLRCGNCRAEYEDIKFGVALAQTLPRAAAPPGTWEAIERRGFDETTGRWGDGATGRQGEVSATPGRLPRPAWLRFSPEVLAMLAVAMAAVGVSLAWYLTNTRNHVGQVAQDKPKQIFTPPRNPPPTSPAWQVESLAGAPQAGRQTVNGTGSLAVGQYLETDNHSRARLEVANIGQVEIAPNTRVKLVQTTATEHRLALERGSLHAQISAPPRLFIVDTPSAVAVDLGCEYTLDVDDDGNSTLHVTGGYVALERDGQTTTVPAGAICHTRRGAGVGTPFFDDVSPALREALASFDFARGGAHALKIIIREARSYDTLTLWHLLPRATGGDRELVYDALASFVAPPPGVTRAGVLQLDKTMLDKWQSEIENLWFE